MSARKGDREIYTFSWKDRNNMKFVAGDDHMRIACLQYRFTYRAHAVSVLERIEEAIQVSLRSTLTLGKSEWRRPPTRPNASLGIIIPSRPDIIIHDIVIKHHAAKPPLSICALKLPCRPIASWCFSQAIFQCALTRSSSSSVRT